MRKVTEFCKKNTILLTILFLGFFLRIAFIGKIPGNGNLNQDEAFAGYEAYSLSNYGMDSHGYHNPVYLEAWGSGMNALETYCMIPFVKLFGLNPKAIRLPQVFLGCITLLFAYLLFERSSDQKTALWATFVLAISPWHVMMCRWGLESNFVVGMLTIAVYLLITANHKIYRVVLAAVFMGLSLYCYSAVWFVLPMIVLGIMAYLFFVHELSVKEGILYVGVLFVMAFPLMLFVAVNMGALQEIRGLISIPKLSFFRKGEINFSFQKLMKTCEMLWKQNDGLVWNSTSQFGLFYHFSKVFFFIGVYGALKKKEKNQIPILIWCFASMIHGTIIYANFNRMNIFFLPTCFLIGEGLQYILSIIVDDSKRLVRNALIAVYALNLILFSRYYVTDYNLLMEDIWFEGMEEALQEANKTQGIVHIENGDMPYPLILYYTKYPTDRFVDTVEYMDPTSPFLQPSRFEGYTMMDFTAEKPIPGDTYLCHKDNTKVIRYMKENNISYKTIGNYIVGWCSLVSGEGSF